MNNTQDGSAAAADQNLRVDPMADAPDYSAMSTAQFANALGMDGWKWSQAFCQRHPEVRFDEMLGWFANAIMAGYDHGQGRGGPVPECCVSCGQDEELRMGVCFECATSGEREAAARSVSGHLGHAFRRMLRGRFDFGTKTDLKWAWERLTRTGDYRPGGSFEQEYGVSA